MKIKRVRFFNIVWDTDDEDPDLPVDVVLPIPANFDVAEDGADLLSDSYGWCVKSFRYEDADSCPAPSV